MRYKLGSVFISVALIAGCGKVEQFVAAAEKAEALERRLAALEKSNDEQNERVDIILGTLDAYVIRIADLEFVNDFENERTIANLSPGSDGYQIISTQYGALVVSFEDIRPYANGSKVIIQFGNPFAASFQSVEFDVEWRSSIDGQYVTNKKRVKIPDQIKWGSWHNVPVTLEEIPPNRLRQISISNFDAKSVVLRTP